MKQIILTLFALLLFTSTANAETSDQELRELLAEAQQALAQPGPRTDRDEAARALRRAIAALQKEPNSQITGRRRHRRESHRDACIELGTKAYGESQYETTAFENARKQCAEPVDSRILAIGFMTYQESFYARTAFEKALVFARQKSLFGKATLLELAIGAYAQTLYRQTALERAAELVANVPPEHALCVQRGFEVYQKAMYLRPALEKAVATCQAN